MANKLYIAVTRSGDNDGWRILVIDSDLSRAEEMAREAIGSMIDADGNVDIYAQTEHYNLRVMPLRIAVRLGYTSERAIQEWYERLADTRHSLRQAQR